MLKNTRLIIPAEMQKEVLEEIHKGHQGIVKCRRRAQESVWWVGLSTQIENVVVNCPNCIEVRQNPEETFQREELPTRPWQRLSADLFKHEKWYLIITDHYSAYFEVFPMTSLTEEKVIEILEELFSRHGICEEFRSDNGP